jgi:ribosomal subunit interface protein
MPGAREPSSKGSSMQINVKGKHLEITEAIDSYVRKKCERLTRYFDKVQSID